MRSIRGTIALAIAAGAVLALPGSAAALPPETTVTSGPAGISNDPAPSFGFASDQSGSSFQCRLDGGVWTHAAPAPSPEPARASPRHVFDPRWEPCDSPWTYRGVEDGDHLFEVRARNSSGETDPTPATRAFTVSTAVAASVRARGVQRQQPGRVRVRLRISAEEKMVAAAGGRIALQRRGGKGTARLGLLTVTARLAAGGAETLALRPERRSQERRIAAALARDRRAEALIAVELTSIALGNRSTRRAAVTLRAP